MPQQTTQTVETNFSQGLKTEFTGLNFPENSVTDTENCRFNRIGNVTRRLGIDFEENFQFLNVDPFEEAIATYKWNNAGGDGETQIVVLQVGATLYFFKSSDATAAAPLSTTKLVSEISFGASTAFECQFADGNGYLFVFHPQHDAFYCTYDAGVVTPNAIAVKIRDTAGIPEPGVTDNNRPQTLSAEHKYNLGNQGWTSGAAFITSSTTSNTVDTGSKTFTVDAGLSAAVGNRVEIRTPADTVDPNGVVMAGNVTSYSATTMVINVTDANTGFWSKATLTDWVIVQVNAGFEDNWFTSIGNYPSNADVWWRFKNASGQFDPATTISDVSLGSGPAPKGFYIIDAFNQDRAQVSSINGLTLVTATAAPRTGTWFQGRVWYTGVDSSFSASGDQPFQTWSENLYFSQTVINPSQFGKCYETNDPTSEDLFDLLPTDGGVITIQGAGAIYKLFPVQNGLLVFAANGVWFITGSQGIGFAANDYTVTKISSIQSISGTSFVDVQGMPVWWNEEGIYIITVTSNQGTPYGPSRGAVSNVGLNVEPLTFTTIQTLYQNIPLSSKKMARGVFDPLSWEIHWLYKNVEATSLTDSYRYDSMLVFNTDTRAFFPWTLSTLSTNATVNSIVYVQSPGGLNSAEAAIKYYTAAGDFTTFAEERATDYVDWRSNGQPTNFVSYFTSGYKLLGAAQHKFQSNYLNIYLNNYLKMAYNIQGIWDFALDRSSGRFTSIQNVITNQSPAYFGVIRRRHKIRGRGMALQIKITSVDGYPFDIIGWSVEQKVNAGT